MAAVLGRLWIQAHCGYGFVATRLRALMSLVVPVSIFISPTHFDTVSMYAETREESVMHQHHDGHVISVSWYLQSFP